MDIRTVSIITDLVLIVLLVIYLISTYKERKRIKNNRKFLTIILFKKRKPSHYRIVDVEGRGVLFVIQGLFGKKWKDVDEDGHSGYKHYFTKLDANDAMNRFVNGIEIGSKDTIYAPFPVNNSGKLKQFPGHRTPPSPPEPQVALKDANELAGKSAAKDAARIAELEKRIKDLTMEKNERRIQIDELGDLFQRNKQTTLEILEENRVDAEKRMDEIFNLITENGDLRRRVKKLSADYDALKKSIKTPSKNATSGK